MPNMSLKVNPRLELERAEQLGRSHDDEAAVTAARRVRIVAERTGDQSLLEDVQLTIDRLEQAAEQWRQEVLRRHAIHEQNEVRGAA